MRKIYFILVVLFLGVAGMTYLYFSNLNTETKANELSLSTIASNSAIVFSFESDNSFYEILSEQDLLQKILGPAKTKQFSSLRTNFANNKDITKGLAGQKVYVGLVPGKEKEIDYLITTQLIGESNPLKILNKIAGTNNLTKIGESYQLNFADSTSCFIALKNQLIIISSSAATTNLVFEERNPNDKIFTNYIKSNRQLNKNTLANVYINYSRLPQLLKKILSTNLIGELSVFNNQHTYASLSYNFSSEKILLNGNTDIKGANSYYQLFDNIPEQKSSITNILPRRTANYVTYSIPEYSVWLKNYKELLNQRKEKEKIDKHILKLNGNYTINLETIFTKYFKQQLVTFQLNTGEKLGAIGLNNGEKVSQLLTDISEEYGNGIRILKEPNIPYAFFGDPFKKFERPYFTIIDNYLIMANYASSIQSFLNDYSNNQLLSNDENYIGFTNQLSSSSTICFYLNNKNSNDIIGRNITMPFFKHYLSKQGFGDFDSICYQLSGEKGRFLTNFLLYKKPTKTIVVDTLNQNPNK